MSGLVGVMWTDGRAARADDAHALLSSLAHRPGPRDCAACGPVALGSLRARELTPAVDRSGACAFVEGRLHNRAELTRVLDLPRAASDVDVVAAAWRKWQRDCARHLIGEFVAVIASGREVLAIRDCGPFHPLFYRRTSTAWLWASELAPLVRDDTPRINEGVVAEYLADRISTSGETLFSGVYRLPPGHAMTVNADGGVDVWRYWHPDPSAAIRYRDQREYNEHFRTVFREAVRCRVRPGSSTALWYSGGVDSTAVATELAELRDLDLLAAAEVQTVSISAPGFDVDETPVFTRGAGHLGLPNAIHPFYFGAFSDFAQLSASSFDMPVVPSMMGARGAWQALASTGVDLTLTGFGGDDWMIGSQFTLIDDVRALRFKSAAARWSADLRTPAGFSASQLLKLAVWLHVPAPARAHLRKRLALRATPAYVSRALASRVSLEDRVRPADTSPPFPTLAQRDLYTSATRANVVVTGEMYSRFAARWAIETAHPFHDRRLIEFALALPGDQLLRPGVSRHIVVDAILRRLPCETYNGTGASDYTSVLREGLRRLGVVRRIEQALEQLPDWLNAAQVRAMAARVEHGDEATNPAREAWALWNILAVHTWFDACIARAAVH